MQLVEQQDCLLECRLGDEHIGIVQNAYFGITHKLGPKKRGAIHRIFNLASGSNIALPE